MDSKEGEEMRTRQELKEELMKLSTSVLWDIGYSAADGTLLDVIHEINQEMVEKYEETLAWIQKCKECEYHRKWISPCRKCRDNSEWKLKKEKK